ncbi:MAG TPA: DUF4912 domain-containing protein [Verrucomicrobiae bacterium]|nr:DUF4912 domain-containing protein [Verrucomicrobiae bacterium]
MKSDKSDKSTLKKAVKAVTKTIRESSAAVAAQIKKTKSAATRKTVVAKAEPAVPEEPPIVAKRIPKTTASKIKRKVPAKPAAPEVPAILLEGDRPTSPVPGGPGQRYALGPTPPPEHLSGTETAELPESYGTKRLFLTARDPHWLYARWDLTRQQQNQYNRLSTDRHLVLRIFLNQAAGDPLAQVHVHPESTHWFCHVPHAGVKYVAQLGYYETGGNWVGISTSGATLTPPDAMSEDFSAEFATIPVEVPFAQLMELARVAVRENVPLAEVLQQLRASGYNIPDARPDGRWTPEREQALASIITMDRVRRVWMGSVEITELIRRQLAQEISSMSVAQFSQPGSEFGISSISSISSPFGGLERKKGFWFNVNAELIIYGATEPDAQVTIGGRTIKLRSDGSFSYRFALPDGDYELPAVAVSSDQTDARAAELSFKRATEYHGDVGAHPQDPQLKLPLAASVA